MVLCGVVVLLGAAVASSCSGTGGAEAPKARGEGKAVPVSVATVVTKTIPLELKTFGTVETASSVSVRAEISGILTKVHIQKGQSVRKDDVLFSIDPRPFEAAVKQAEAVLARDKIQAKNLAAEAARTAELIKKGIASKSDVEKSAADAEALAAAVQADEAALETTRLQLEHCTIRSPIAGRVGNLLVTEGNLVKAADQSLAVINQISPIEVFFSISQAELTELRRHMAQGKLKVGVILPDEPDQCELGDLTFVDNALDKASGTVQLAGTFENPKERLWPGQYVSVVLTLGERKDAVVVPSRAIQAGRDSKYVFVVAADATAEMRPVVVGIAGGEESVVDKGLAAGEVVVTDGHVRLTKGAKVEVRRAGELKAAPTPSQAEAVPAAKSSAARGGGA
jgi:membrane fusion protein, multidrug efflux system